jgi:YggT family protein
MGPIIQLLLVTILELIKWLVIISAIFSWLVAFNVVNVRNQFVYQVVRFLDAVTDPLLRPIRRFVPLLGGVDVSPIVLLLAIWFLQQVIAGPTSPVARLFYGW